MRPARIVALAVLASGCVLPLGGLDPDAQDAGAPGDAGGDMDSSVRRDAGNPWDSGPLIPADAGPQPDGSTCAPGFVDVDMNPANGCECELTIDLIERCNGRDDDCDASTFDGSGETVLGMPCDGDDSDFCRDGLWACNVGVLVCSDPLVDSLERCDTPGDEDCDGQSEEGGAVDATLFYDDDDMDTYGDDADTRPACVMPSGYVARGGDCDDTTPSISPGTAEGCNGRDDDCSGLVDDNGACSPCTVVHDEAAPYLVCVSNALGWSGAAGFCNGVGYRLVTFETAAENTWLAGAANAVASGRYWIGLSQGGPWTWTDGVSLSARGWDAWASGEPNNGGPGCCRPDEDCAELNSGSATWNDYECDQARAFLCERPP